MLCSAIGHGSMRVVGLPSASKADYVSHVGHTGADTPWHIYCNGSESLITNSRLGTTANEW